MSIQTNKFMFYENFLKAIDRLDEQDRAKACYEFCRYGITGELPKDKNLAMFCLGVSVSVQKYDGRGGRRENAGRQKKQQNQTVSENQKNQKNQKNHNTQTETLNININNKENKKEKSLNKKYGECQNVLLTEEQYNDLFAKHNNLDLAIEKLDTWLGTSGSKNRNKNHYAYFKSNSWVWENLKSKDDDFYRKLEML